ncbi:hypothetical protein [Photobacterium nomapromontoriensis]|uniref:hypothetical protein n=1 Tax=Photobacterium nomapromontoriensis TaxID=2910237 RepID=UPI003D11E90B
MTIEITGNETLDELEALLDSFDDLDIADEQFEEVLKPAEQLVQKTDTELLPSDGDTNVVPPATDEVLPGQGEEQQPVKKVIIAKDGEHTIPYDVLEAERRESERLRQQIAEMQKQGSELQNTTRLLEIRDKQLEKLGVAPEDLPENLNVTDQQMDDLKENYPELAPFIQSLMAKVSTIPQSQPQAAESAANPVLDDIKANADLNGWMEEKGDKWRLALDIDDRLLTDPQWQGKPQTERFAEVARRTKAAFGEVEPVAHPSQVDPLIADKAKAKEQEVETSLPPSPSAVGASNQHQATLLQQAVSMDNSQLQNLMAGMTADQIDALLDQADF